MSIAKHEWAWECDRELCTVCGEERPSEYTIRDLRAEVERLKWMLNQSVADHCADGGPKSGSGVSTCKSCSSALADLAARYAESRG